MQTNYDAFSEEEEAVLQYLWINRHSQTDDLHIARCNASELLLSGKP